MLPVIRAALRKYPKTVEAIANCHIRYNETSSYIASQEKDGKFLVLCPSRALEVGAREKDPEKLKRAYQLRRKDGKKRINEIAVFCQS